MASVEKFADSLKYVERLHFDESFWGKKHLVLLLDYDGTLSPLQSHPSLANLPERNRELLKSIISHPNTTLGIISGRGVEDAKSKIQFSEAIYAGNHGFEIHFPDGFVFTFDFTDEMREQFEKMVWDLNAISKDGAWVEDKKYSVTYHVRQVPDHLKKELLNTATNIIVNRGFTANPAHEATEAKAPISWNKGYAAEYILKKKFGENWAEDASVIFMGDDTTDEDVMRALKGRALTFRVTSDPSLDTHASYRIPSTDTVTEVLEKIEKRLLKDFK